MRTKEALVIVMLNSSEHKRMMRKILVPMRLRDYFIPLGVLLVLASPWAVVIWLLTS